MGSLPNKIPVEVELIVEVNDSAVHNILSVTLSNGVRQPAIGLGTAFFVDGICRPELAYRAVAQALEIGYRHFDTAPLYGTEVRQHDSFR